MSDLDRSGCVELGRLARGDGRARRDRGSVVTWVITFIMIVSLAIYLGVAFFTDQSAGPAQSGAETTVEGGQTDRSPD